jgi:predicted nucleic acid-binding Zn ribbon protein
VSERVCKACGGPLPTTHPNRKFCSEHCRKRLWDSENRWKPCVDCGTPISDDRRARCISCSHAHRADQHEAKLALVEAMYKAGVPVQEIGVRLGRKGGSGTVGPELLQLRKAGRIGYRYKTRAVDRSSA